VSRPELLIAISILFLIEVNHLKWIIWNHWDCKHCGVVHRQCQCKDTPKWMLFL